MPAGAGVQGGETAWRAGERVGVWRRGGRDHGSESVAVNVQDPLQRQVRLLQVARPVPRPKCRAATRERPCASSGEPPLEAGYPRSYTRLSPPRVESPHLRRAMRRAPSGGKEKLTPSAGSATAGDVKEFQRDSKRRTLLSASLRFSESLASLASESLSSLAHLSRSRIRF